jgi:hypothetical protein
MNSATLPGATVDAVQALLDHVSRVAWQLRDHARDGSIVQLARLLVTARDCAADLDDAGGRRFSDGSAVRLTRRPGVAGGPARRRLVDERPAGKIQDLWPGGW